MVVVNAAGAVEATRAKSLKTGIGSVGDDGRIHRRAIQMGGLQQDLKVRQRADMQQPLEGRQLVFGGEELPGAFGGL